jgi:hypothetical protein
MLYRKDLALQPPPSLSLDPSLNSDTTKLTLVECVRNTPTCPTSSMSFNHECTFRVFRNKPLNPLSSWVDTSNGVDFPLQKKKKSSNIYGTEAPRSSPLRFGSQQDSSLSSCSAASSLMRTMWKPGFKNAHNQVTTQSPSLLVDMPPPWELPKNLGKVRQ